MILFESNAPGFDFTGFEIGWFSVDSDMRAYTGDVAMGFDLAGRQFSQLKV